MAIKFTTKELTQEEVRALLEEGRKCREEIDKRLKRMEQVNHCPHCGKTI